MFVFWLCSVTFLTFYSLWLFFHRIFWCCSLFKFIPYAAKTLRLVLSQESNVIRSTVIYLYQMVVVNDFIAHFENKVKQFTDERRTLDDSECQKLGKKDSEAYPFLTMTCCYDFILIL